MKREAGTIEATPSKRVYLSIIADYDLNKSICELVDNAYDSWIRRGKTQPLNVLIKLDADQQSILVADNSGGVKESELESIVSPGETSNKPGELVIGMFGVGTKRAVVALAEKVRITSRFANKTTFRVEFDEDWLESDDWNLSYFEVDKVLPGTTQISLHALRRKVTDQSTKSLRDYLGSTYSRFLNEGTLSLKVNSKDVKPKSFDNWAYPPGYPPQEFSGALKNDTRGSLKASVTGGLVNAWSPGGEEYGVYFYCNDRLIAKGLKTLEVGFASKLGGIPHPSAALCRVIVSLNGDPDLMPWNSSKSGINFSHATFLTLQRAIVAIVSQYASLSRRYVSDWEDLVFKFTSGSIVKRKSAQFPPLKQSYFPDLPRTRFRFGDMLEQRNKDLAIKKPWVVGLYETIIAVDRIYNGSLAQRNRICLILLDSTLEIGFKEYLVHEAKDRTKYREDKLAGLFVSRPKVQEEIANHVVLKEETWGKIDNYYWLRCDLIHKRASFAISDGEIEDYRTIVESVLGKLFGLKFS